MDMSVANFAQAHMASCTEATFATSCMLQTSSHNTACSQPNTREGQTLLSASGSAFKVKVQGVMLRRKCWGNTLEVQAGAEGGRGGASRDSRHKKGVPGLLPSLDSRSGRGV